MVMGANALFEKAERYARPAVAVPVLALIALVIRLKLFVGICRLDMFRYLEISHYVHNGGSLFDPQVFYASARLPLMLPLIWANGLLGYGELASVAWQLVCSLLSVVFAYYLARELFDDKTAAVAGVLMAVFPLEIELATQLLPDAVEGMLLLGAVLFAVIAARRDDHWRRWAILSGALLALAYYTRVNALVLLPGLLVAGAIVRPSSWRRAAWIPIGMALVAVVFAGVFWLLSGDPLVDFHKTQEFYSSYRSTGFIARADTFLGMIRKETALIWLLRLAPLALIGAFVKRDRGATLLSVWVVGFFVYLEWVSPLHGLDSSYRYIEPLVPPFLILAAAGVTALLKGGRLWRVLAVAAIGVLVAALMIRAGDRAGKRYSGHPRWRSLRAVAERLADNPEQALYVDNSWHFVAVNYYAGYSLGRVTLEKPDAPLNASARLFSIAEKPPAQDSRAWILLSEKTKTPPAGARLIQSYPSSDGDLGLYSVE